MINQQHIGLTIGLILIIIGTIGLISVFSQKHKAMANKKKSKGIGGRPKTKPKPQKPKKNG